MMNWFLFITCFSVCTLFFGSTAAYVNPMIESSVVENSSIKNSTVECSALVKRSHTLTGTFLHITGTKSLT